MRRPGEAPLRISHPSPWLLFILLDATLALGCSNSDQPVPFPVTIRVESDPGVPLAGATLTKAGKESTPTGPDGRVTLTLFGKEGETVALFVRCPPGFVSPMAPIAVGLRRSTEGKLPEYDALCPPSIRHMVVAVRAENGPNLPVLYLGRPIGRTNAVGAATLLFGLHPGDALQLKLDTTEKGNERLVPASPSKSWIMKTQDDIVVLDQTFTLKALPSPPPKVVHRPKTVRSHAKM
jgi:hypothetical protein